MFTIIDWASNIMFNGQLFVSFDDAENFLAEKLGDNYDSDRGEYYITEILGG